MRYASNDGKLFDSEYECLEHEKQLDYVNSRENRYKELYEKAEELAILVRKFNRDYSKDGICMGFKLAPIMYLETLKPLVNKYDTEFRT